MKSAEWLHRLALRTGVLFDEIVIPTALQDWDAEYEYRTGLRVSFGHLYCGHEHGRVVCTPMWPSANQFGEVTWKAHRSNQL